MILPVVAIMVQANEESPPSLTIRDSAKGTTRGNQPPVVTIGYPLNGATVSGIVTITGTASDDGTVKSVKISIDGGAYKSASSSNGYATWSFSWDTTQVADGSHSITAKAQDNKKATGTDSVTVTVSNSAPPPPPPPPPGGKYALIVGISNYKNINDLKYCDDDANDWYDYLNGLGYQCTVLGDQTSSYHRWDGVASRANIIAQLTALASVTGTGSTVAIVLSGHGDYTSSSTQYFCCWDSSRTNYNYDLSDATFASLVKQFQAENVFLFFDSCFSGGFIPNVQANNPSGVVYMTTTCTSTGYGYDDSLHQNGLWTYWFLQAGLATGGSGHADMEGNFDWAYANYPWYPYTEDQPQEWDEVGNSLFYF